MTRPYEIAVPFRDRNQPMLEAIDDLRFALNGEERDLSREILSDALVNEGDRTVGDLLDRLNRADPDQRRAVLDRARQAVGLEPIAIVERRRELRQAQRDDPPPPLSRRAAGALRDADGGAWVICAADGCKTIPIGDQGEPVPVRAVRWWCAVHRDLAAPGDLDEWRPPPVRFGPAGLAPTLTEEDKRYYAELDREREEEDARRNRERREAAERLERLEREHRARLPRTPGF